MLKIRSKLIIKTIFQNIKENKLLQLIKYNKKIQNKLNISIGNYREYNQIQIQLKLDKEYITIKKFINFEIINKKYIHIYANKSKNEYDSCFLNGIEWIWELNIILEFEFKKFKGLFKDCECLKEINIIKCNRKDIIDISEMFYGCKNLDKLNISNLKTDNVKDMSYIFYECSSLNEINLLNFNTSNVTNMQNMFEKCNKLEELNLYNFNTSNVIYMNDMFFECTSLKSININSNYLNLAFKSINNNNNSICNCSLLKQKNNWNTSNVINMSYMFYNCKSLRELNISQFDTSKVIDMSYMFYNCYSLSELKLTKFNFYNVLNMTHMFDGCTSLINLDIPNLDIKNNTRIKYMFYNLNIQSKNKLKDRFNDIDKDTFDES